ncbi:MAG: SRPBCC domain-containing protein [Bacteroidota bacterium]
MSTQKQPLVVEKIINAPVARVWKAITNHAELQKWYFQMAAFEPKKGFEFTFDAKSNGQTFTHLCKVTEVDRKQKAPAYLDL